MATAFKIENSTNVRIHDSWADGVKFADISDSSDVTITDSGARSPGTAITAERSPRLKIDNFTADLARGPQAPPRARQTRAVSHPRRYYAGWRPPGTPSRPRLRTAFEQFLLESTALVTTLRYLP